MDHHFLLGIKDIVPLSLSSFITVGESAVSLTGAFVGLWVLGFLSGLLEELLFIINGLQLY
jgi:hypothetical protein